MSHNNSYLAESTGELFKLPWPSRAPESVMFLVSMTKHRKKRSDIGSIVCFCRATSNIQIWPEGNCKDTSHINFEYIETQIRNELVYKSENTQLRVIVQDKEWASENVPWIVKMVKTQGIPVESQRFSLLEGAGIMKYHEYRHIKIIILFGHIYSGFRGFTLWPNLRCCMDVAIFVHHLISSPSSNPTPGLNLNPPSYLSVTWCSWFVSFPSVLWMTSCYTSLLFRITANRHSVRQISLLLHSMSGMLSSFRGPSDTPPTFPLHHLSCRSQHFHTFLPTTSPCSGNSLLDSC